MSRLIDTTLSTGYAWLRFPRELEARFVVDGALQRRRLLQAGGAGSIVLFLGMVIADALMMSDVLAWAVALRLGVYVIPVVLGMLAMNWWSIPRLSEWLVAVAGTGAGLVCMGLTLLSDSPWAVATLVSLNLVVVFATTIGRFWPVVVVAVLLNVGNVLTIGALAPLDDPLSIASILLLMASTSYALFGNYTLEHRERTAYLLALQERELQQELASANEVLSQTARTDPLTGVANRRYFDDYLEQVWAYAQSERHSLALIVIDVDHFKAYNDRHGHPAGDACLRSVVQAIGSCLRKPGDFIARWGGEEFAVVMTGAGLETAQQAAERIRQAVVDASIVHDASPTSPVVTVSLGVSSVAPGPESRLGDFVATADACLYEAKARGRNRWWARWADPLGGLPRSTGWAA